MTRWTVATGAVLATLGFGAGLVALALPWARFRVTADAPLGGGQVEQSGGIAVFQLDRGWWFVTVLFALIALVAVAGTAGPAAARIAGPAAVALGCLAVALAFWAGESVSGGATPSVAGLPAVDVRTDRGVGMWYGSLAGALLGLGAALVSRRWSPGAVTGADGQ